MRGSLTIYLIIIVILILIFGFFLFYPQFLSKVMEDQFNLLVIEEEGENFLQEEKTNSWLIGLQENFNYRCQQSIKEIQADQAWQTTKNFFWRLLSRLKEKIL